MHNVRKNLWHHHKFCKFRNFLWNSENSGISGKSGNFENVGKFPISKLFFRISEISKRRNFSENFVFYKTALRSSVHIIKISVKLVEIVFFGKNPENSTSPETEIPEKWFFRFFGRQRCLFLKIHGISGKSDVFGGKFPKIRKIGKSGNFEKKAKTSILENSTRLQSVLKRTF
jgi:hypothetical protein